MPAPNTFNYLNYVSTLQSRRHVALVRDRIPDATIENEGELLSLGDLSPGCRACKSGSWDCLFITQRCNLNCDFCYSPHALPLDYFGSALGRTKATLEKVYTELEVTGVSLSGGEALLELKLVLDMLGWLKTRFPRMYVWLYTNGILATSVTLQALNEAGLDEIRFNMAATGYDRQPILARLQDASRQINRVSVEIPTIPDHRQSLLQALPKWADAGVTFLNLHELIYEPGTNSADLIGERCRIRMPDGHKTAIHPRSRDLTLEIMETVYGKGLTLNVNDCSLQSKIRQHRGRRRMIARMIAEPHEMLVDDLYLESLMIREGNRVRRVHPRELSFMRAQNPGCRIEKQRKVVPLALNFPSERAETAP